MECTQLVTSSNLCGDIPECDRPVTDALEDSVAKLRKDEASFRLEKTTTNLKPKFTPLKYLQASFTDKHDHNLVSKYPEDPLTSPLNLHETDNKSM